MYFFAIFFNDEVFDFKFEKIHTLQVGRFIFTYKGEQLQAMKSKEASGIKS